MKTICAFFLVLLIPSQALALSPASTTVVIKPIPLDHGDLAPFDGILISEADAEVCVVAKSEASRYKIETEVEKEKLEAYTGVYRDAIESYKKKLEAIQPNWFERNSLQIGVGVGVVIGIVLTIATLKIAAAVQ